MTTSNNVLAVGGNLEDIDAAYRKSLPPHLRKQNPQAEHTAVRTGEDIASISEMLAERATAAGRYAKEHGEYIESLCAAFAKEQHERSQAFTTKLMAAENKKASELKRLLQGG